MNLRNDIFKTITNMNLRNDIFEFLSDEIGFLREEIVLKNNIIRRVSRNFSGQGSFLQIRALR